MTMCEYASMYKEAAIKNILSLFKRVHPEVPCSWKNRIFSSSLSVSGLTSIVFAPLVLVALRERAVIKGACAVKCVKVGVLSVPQVFVYLS